MNRIVIFMVMERYNDPCGYINGYGEVTVNEPYSEINGSGEIIVNYPYRMK